MPLQEQTEGIVTKIELLLEHIIKSIGELQLSSSFSAQQQLATDIRFLLTKYDGLVQELSILADEERSQQDRQHATRKAQAFQQRLPEMRKDFRAALLRSKHAIDSRGLSNRTELLRRPSNAKSEDSGMAANQNLTDSLRRTVNVMQQELERSVLSSQILESSTATLRSTKSEHDRLDVIMDGSRQLIQALERSDWLDRLLIGAALVFFVLVVLFILKQRVLDRGLRIAFWWTRWLPDWSGDAALGDRAAGTPGTLSTVSTAVASSTLMSPATPMANRNGGTGPVGGSVQSTVAAEARGLGRIEL